MQRIERYGVIALVFLLVTILAVSLWGEHRGQSVFSFLKRDKKKAPTDELTADLTSPRANPGEVALPQNDPLHPKVPLGSPARGASTTLTASPEARTTEPGPESSSSLLAAPSEFGDRFDAYSPPSGPAESFVPVATLGYAESPSIAPPREGNVAPPAAESSGVRAYVVKSGETLGEIAQRELGTYRRWTEIQKLNAGLDPERLRAGMKIKLPASAASRVARAEASPAAKPQARPPAAAKASAPKASADTAARYQIKGGDTLSSIAQRELGDADRWNEIVVLNPGLDPKRLIVGSRVNLPAARAARAPEERVAVASASPKKGRVR